MIREMLYNARIAVQMARMQARNLFAASSAVDGTNTCSVSLTSYGRRTSFVHLAVESIAAGNVLPGRLILWLDEQQFADLSSFKHLTRLIRRGVEIYPTVDLGPHKKYYPYIYSLGWDRGALVTADDDTLYPVDWLARLLETSKAFPNNVVAHRAHFITLDRTGKVRPYREWQHVAPERHPSFRVFPVGVGGVMYPVEMLAELRERGDGFKSHAPTADDVWLHASAVRSNIKAVAAGAIRESAFLPIRGARVKGLEASNVSGGGNDMQISRTYGTDVVGLIVSDTD